MYLGREYEERLFRRDVASIDWTRWRFIRGGFSLVALIHKNPRPRKEGQARRRNWSRFGIQQRCRLKAFGTGFLLWVLIGTIGMPLASFGEQRKTLGMWVWSRSSFATEEARHQLVQFCVEHRIRHLDVHVTMTHDGDNATLKDAEAFKDLIMLATQHGITIAALRGNPKMFFSENHDRTLRELRAIIAFSRTLPPRTSFKGIKYDVEPYATKEWKGGETLLYPVILDYLTLLRGARSTLDKEASQLWLAVDTPFWWDKDRFAVEFEGKRKRLSEHVQDLSDFVTIMSYRRSSRKILDCVAEERRYAQRIRKFIFPSLETIKLEQDPHISFWGVPKEEFWKVIPELMDEAECDPAIGGVMLHCYRSLFEKFNNSAPFPPKQMTSD